jgi:hypothetical protein
MDTKKFFDSHCQPLEFSCVRVCYVLIFFNQATEFAVLKQIDLDSLLFLLLRAYFSNRNRKYQNSQSKFSQ